MGCKRCSKNTVEISNDFSTANGKLILHCHKDILTSLRLVFSANFRNERRPTGGWKLLDLFPKKRLSTAFKTDGTRPPSVCTEIGCNIYWQIERTPRCSTPWQLPAAHHKENVLR